MDKQENPQPKNHIRRPIKEDTPLTPWEWDFVNEYIRSGVIGRTVKKTIPEYKNKSLDRCCVKGQMLLAQANVKAEIKRVMDEARNEAVANAQEVMQFFTAVMRGEVKDQFGLDATLSDRTKAAQELARRTVDLENRKAGEPDQLVAIKLDWSRDK